MKKLLLSITLFLSLIQAASASEGYYIGAEATQNQLNYKNVSALILADGSSYPINSKDYYKATALGYGVFAGKDFKDFEVELGYNHFSNDKTNGNTGLALLPSGSAISTKSTVKLDMISADFKPIFRANQFSFMPIVGLTYARANFKEQYMVAGTQFDSISESQSKLGFDVGFGIKYQVSEHFFVRTQAKYTRLDIKTNKTLGAAGLNYVATASVGAGYSF